MTKRIIAAALCAASLLTFASCGKSICDSCGREENCSKVTYEGETANLCKDCKALVEAAQELADAFGY
ncbi:MAG: hypothetical protein IJY93_10265 [Clostridia bacterium]|nr:hypothetical protein [Clostridia bacterium]